MDFNANKVKQYEAVRQAVARKYNSLDINFFAPESTTSIPEDIDEKQASVPAYTWPAGLPHVIPS